MSQPLTYSCLMQDETCTKLHYHKTTPLSLATDKHSSSKYFQMPSCMPMSELEYFLHERLLSF